MSLLNRVWFRAVSGGLGDFVVASAIVGYYTPLQADNPAIVDGQTYSYVATSDDETQHEEGFGVWDTGTDTITRATITSSSNAGAKVNFSAAPKVMLTDLDRDFGRDVLIADRDYFVDAGTGSDLDDGLTSGTAFATIQRAVDEVCGQLDLANFNVTINVADGTYNEEVVCSPYIGVPPAGVVSIIGNTTTWTNVTVSGDVDNPTLAVLAIRGAGARWRIRGMRLQYAAGGFGYLLLAQSGGFADYGQIDFDGDAGAIWANVEVELKGFAFQFEPVTISNSSSFHSAMYDGSISNSFDPVTITTPINLQAWVDMDGQSFSFWGATTFVNPGDVTGALYRIANGSVLQLDTVTLPGDSAGIVDFGSVVKITTGGFSGGVASFVFADLPTGVLGRHAVVTNSNTATWGATIAGGGANTVLAWYNGTNWTVIGA